MIANKLPTLALVTRPRGRRSPAIPPTRGRRSGDDEDFNARYHQRRSRIPGHRRSGREKGGLEGRRWSEAAKSMGLIGGSMSNTIRVRASAWGRFIRLRVQVGRDPHSKIRNIVGLRRPGTAIHAGTAAYDKSK